MQFFIWRLTTDSFLCLLSRPLIKHVIMAYGVDIPTEAGYVYSKKYDVVGKRLVDRNETEIPNLKAVIWEDGLGKLTAEQIEAPRGSIAEVLIKKKPKRSSINATVDGAQLPRSGDGSVPYLSLSWAHTWLLHAARAKRYIEDRDNIVVENAKNVLDHIRVSHRPRGAITWVDGAPGQPETVTGKDGLKPNPDTGTNHPHGTRYKPEMHRYHNVGVSRTTGIEYTTTVLEAVGVEHKETTRNYDILAAVFTDVLKYMHDDMNLV